jgi:drug/metabolite transporter (DMT)-like permease
MSPKLMIWLSVILSAVAQVLLKQGLNNVRSRTGANSSPATLIVAVATQAWVWLWGVCFVFATGLWLLGLQKLDLSYAYPLLSVGYILVNLLSAIFFHERVDGMRWVAVAVISVGVVLIAGS